MRDVVSLNTLRMKKEYSQRINKVIDYINLNLSEDLNLENIAEVANFSPYHFHRIFHAAIGETLSVYINRLRLERAAHKLRRNMNLSITEIALECGFSSSSSFSRVFKTYFSMTPTVYRNQFLKESFAYSFGAGAVCGERQEPGDNELLMEPAQYAKFHNFSCNIRVEYLPSYHVAYVRSFGFIENTYNERIENAFRMLRSWLSARDLIDDTTLCLGITYDDTAITKPERCRYISCYTVPEEVMPDGNIGIQDTPAGKYVICNIEGEWDSYGELFLTTMDYIFGVWFPQSGYEPGDELSYMEKYNSVKSEIMNIELCIPVKPY